MREQLKNMVGVRSRFRGKIERFGHKDAYRGLPRKTVLLKDVVRASDDKDATDHIWLTCGKWSENISEGDMIEFNARVTSYKKGYQGHRFDIDILDAPPPSVDYRLSHPTQVKIIAG